MFQIAPGNDVFAMIPSGKPAVAARKHAAQDQPANSLRFGGTKRNITIRVIGAALIAVSGAFFTKVFPGGPQSPYGAPSHIVNGIDMAKLSDRLESEGITGTLHAAAHDKRQYVFTYRDPENFFNNIQISLQVPKAVIERFQAMNRHDEIRIKGYFIDASRAQPHIKVTDAEIVRKWNASIHAPDTYQRPVLDLRRELEGKSEITALVHAIQGDQNVVVLEYQGHIIPLVVPDKTFTETLWRDDVIKVRFHLQDSPRQPQHLELNTDTSGGLKPIEVVEPISSLHQRQMTLEGNLVLFPKSPIINRDIWAIEYPGPNGLNRYFTLFNFEDAEDMKAVDAKLRGFWETRPDGVKDGREKLINTQVRIRATGIVNIVDPNQANPQLTLKYQDLSLTP